MGLFKTQEEKEAIKKQKEKEEFEQSVCYLMGLTIEDEKEVARTIQKAQVDCAYSRDDGRVSDVDMIKQLFPKLSNKEQMLISYYGNWARKLEYNKYV